MPRIVHPTGPTNSPPLALIGEAPGMEEARQGKPFVGRSGQLLDRMLATTGISRDECYLDNVVNVRPPNNNFGVFYDDAKRTKPTVELINYREALLKRLMVIRPKVIVPLGGEALRAVTISEIKITEHRGCMIEMDRGKPSVTLRILPTLHPAHVLRMYSDRPVVELDLKKAWRQARHPSKPQTFFTIKPTLDQVLQFFEQRLTPVAFDIESIGPCTRSLGFAWSATQAISIPLIWKGTHYWSHEDEAIILQALKNYLGDPQIEKYLQNGPYDLTIIGNELGLGVDGFKLDTMYAHHLLYPELRKGLDFFSSIYTDFPMYWGPEKLLTDEANAEYNCYDCVTTWITAQKVYAELSERHLLDFYRRRIHPTIFALTRMQNRGIKVDIGSRETIRTRTKIDLEDNRARLTNLAGRDVNPNSPKQVKELIYGEWKLPLQYREFSRQRIVTTGDDALRTLSRKHPSYAPALKAILKCRQLRNLISSYIDTKLDNGRARTSYGLTVTGRITSSKTWDGYGGNLQNIPRGSFRRLYVPDPGKVLIKADLKQAEYMIFCWDAPVPELVDKYLNEPNFDVHMVNAVGIFGRSPDEITKEQRYEAKQAGYAGNYQIGPLKLSRMYDMEFRKAKFALDRYRAIRPELEIWWERIEEQLRTTRTLKNQLGRERIFFGRMDRELFRKGCNWIPQSTVADIINQAVTMLDEDPVVQLLLQVHDELVCQCMDNPDTIRAAVSRVRSAMEVPVKFPHVDVPLVIPVEIAVGKNWYDITDYIP